MKFSLVSRGSDDCTIVSRNCLPLPHSPFSKAPSHLRSLRNLAPTRRICHFSNSFRDSPRGRSVVSLCSFLFRAPATKATRLLHHLHLSRPSPVLLLAAARPVRLLPTTQTHLRGFISLPSLPSSTCTRSVEATPMIECIAASPWPFGDHCWCFSGSTASIHSHGVTTKGDPVSHLC